ncbi:hypothetical protein BHM03_00059604 [Ensete ventricosum]|nr:hypothetical protein BHM03_00059604 [Ensete ventricosum]
MSYESHGVPPAISNHTASDKLQVDFHVILAEDREIFQVQSYPRATLQLLWNPLYPSPSQGGDGGASSESHAWRSDAAIVSDSSSFAYLECGVGAMKTDTFKDYISISCSSLPSSCDHCSMVCRRNHPSKLPPGHAPPTDADQTRHQTLIMLARIIFFAAVSAATLAVILLPLLSSVPRKSEKRQTGPWLALSLYVHSPSRGRPHQQAGLHGHSAFVFHHDLREGPENTSRVIGGARGIVLLPGRQFELFAFNIVHLALDTAAYSGSLSVEARRVGRRGREELAVVGGTGSFAFARGHAAFSVTKERRQSDADAIYRLDLRLMLPEEPPTIPG